MYAEYGRCGSAAKFGFIMVQAPLTLDASVILDMHSVNSLDRLLAVDREFLTTDFVFNTIRNSISHSSFAKLEECMVKRNLLSRTEAVDNLTTLMDGNRTLRKEECEKKIVRWKN